MSDTLRQRAEQVWIECYGCSRCSAYHDKDKPLWRGHRRYRTGADKIRIEPNRQQEAR